MITVKTIGDYNDNIMVMVVLMVKITIPSTLPALSSLLEELRGTLSMTLQQRWNRGDKKGWKRWRGRVVHIGKRNRGEKKMRQINMTGRRRKK